MSRTNMDEKTREALEGSIKKWEDIVAGVGIDLGPGNCPLCQLFLNPYPYDEDKCVGCPVLDRTGRKGCQATPYEDYEYAEMYYGNKAPETKQHAVLELEFLKSLRPSESLPAEERQE